MRFSLLALIQRAALFAMLCAPARAQVEIGDLLEKAEAGDVSYEAKVGLAYCFGIGVPLDYQQGRVWLQKAADAHSPVAESALGWLYDKGLGVPQDDHQAWHWYRAGATAGDANGQECVAEFYAAGRVVPKDDAQAAAWWTKAAAQGNTVAENHLGVAYQRGEGVEKNAETAFTYFLQAASHNFGPAQFNVALCYWNGSFVPRDPVKAYLWCTLAQRSFADKEVDELMHQLSTTLTGAQLEAGDALVDNWTQQQTARRAPAGAAASFASGQSAEMPFHNVVGHIVITGSLEGHGNIHFLIDTGASASFLDEKTATRLGIKPSDTYATGNGIGKDLLLSAVANPIQVGLPGLDLKNVTFRLFPTSSWDRAIGLHIDGIIGTDILQHYAMHIDYRRRLLRIMNPAALDTSRAGDPIPLQIQHSLILVQATVRKFNTASNPTSLIVDTGSNESITLSRNFLSANPDLHFARGVYSYSLGGGGSSDETITRCSAVQLGDMIVRNPLVHLLTQNQGLWAAGWAGSVGNDILQRFDVTINFPGAMLYLRPNTVLGDIEEYDAGLLLKSRGWINRNYFAAGLTPGGAAARAGLAVGDVLVEVDNIALKGLSLEDSRALLRSPGRHNVVVNRGGKTVLVGVDNT
jgi:hypothetical protein